VSIGQQPGDKRRLHQLTAFAAAECRYSAIRIATGAGIDMTLTATRAAALGLIACVAFGVAAPASAETAASTGEQARLLQTMLKHPGDYDATFAYVRVSEALGDYEAAIGALERLLFYNGKLTRVKYELGTLYYRVGSYQMAADYFRQAEASPDLDPETRSRIDAYLPLTEKELQPVRTWVFAQTGVRVQSNAAATPLSNTVDSYGYPFPIDPSVPSGPDANVFALGQLANDIDFGDQAGDKLETRLTGYAAGQFTFNSLDIAYLSGSFGPRFALAPTAWSGLTIKPYVTGTAAWVGGTEYNTSAGAGVSLTAPFGKTLSVTPMVEWQHATYPGSGYDSTLGDSDWVTAGASATLRLSEAVSLNATFGYRRTNAIYDWQSNNAWVEEFDLPIRFNPPAASIGQKWTVTPFAIFTQVGFDAPNESIDPWTVRRDNKWQAGFAIDAPLTPHLGFSAAVSYEHTDSTITNYAYDNWSVLGGPTARF
jgi:hypothetical protein